MEDLDIYSYRQCPARYARKFNEERQKLIRKQKELTVWSNREKSNLPAKSREEAFHRALQTFIGKNVINVVLN